MEPAPLDPPDPIDPGHACRRAALSRVGLALLVVGVPCGLLGVTLFVSCFFWPPEGGGLPIRPPLGLVLAGIGGFLTVFGLNALTFGNLGRIARYQAAEGVPVSKDVLREMTPATGDFLRTTASAARQGWTAPAPSPAHACGTVNEPGAKYCKGCGQPLTLTCPACGATNAPDARFCNQCGRPVVAENP
jgi:hypothetical protein